MVLLCLTTFGAGEDTSLDHSHPAPTCKELVATAERDVFPFPIKTLMISKPFLFCCWTELRSLGHHSGDGENKKARKRPPRTASISLGIAPLIPAAGLKPPTSLQVL